MSAPPRLNTAFCAAGPNSSVPDATVVMPPYVFAPVRTAVAGTRLVQTDRRARKFGIDRSGLDVVSGAAGERAGAAERAAADLQRADRRREGVDVQRAAGNRVIPAGQTPRQRHGSRSALIQARAAAEADVDRAVLQVAGGRTGQTACAGDGAAGDLERADRRGNRAGIQCAARDRVIAGGRDAAAVIERAGVDGQSAGVYAGPIAQEGQGAGSVLDQSEFAGSVAAVVAQTSIVDPIRRAIDGQHAGRVIAAFSIGISINPRPVASERPATVSEWPSSSTNGCAIPETFIVAEGAI